VQPLALQTWQQQQQQQQQQQEQPSLGIHHGSLHLLLSFAMPTVCCDTNPSGC
jgi:transcription initiation factor TFIID subunit TAF12